MGDFEKKVAERIAAISTDRQIGECPAAFMRASASPK